jgi:hypothetical protein
MKNMQIKLSVILLLTLFLVTASLTGAEVTKQILADSTLVHTPFALDIYIAKNPDQKVIPAEAPEWVKTLKVNGISEIVSDSTVIFTYSLASYAPPLCSIPAFTFFVVAKDSLSSSKTDTLTSEAMSIIVTSQFVNDTVAPERAGLGDPMKAGKFPLGKMMGIIGISLLVLIAVVLIIAWIRSAIMKRQNRTFWGEPIKVTPPYEEAIEALNLFDVESKVESEDLKLGTFELSNILKRYIGRRFQCQVHESTSSEFRKWIRESDLTREQKNQLEAFIAETDPVKFANMAPSHSAMEKMYSLVKAFVMETRPVTEEEEK